MQKAKDPLGHQLLQSRIDLCPKVVSEYLKELPNLDLDKLKTFSNTQFIVCGIGSSKAHANYLVYLLNQKLDLRAEYWELSAFMPNKIENAKNKILIIISQGLSANAQIALAKRKQFKDCIIFTAASVYSLEKLNKSSTAKLFKKLKQESRLIINFPLENEYAILIRVIGPLLGYIAVFHFAKELAKIKNIKFAGFGNLVTTLKNSKNTFSNNFDLTKIDPNKDLLILTSAPLINFSQNLAYKLMEGAFWALPDICDLTQFAHGHFQALALKEKNVVILNQDSILTNLACKLLKKLNIEPIILESNLPTTFQILEYEMIFNYLMLWALKKTKINQINWPAKGLDHELYEFSNS